MTDKQAVLDALQRLPESATLDEITEELRIMAAIRRGREDVAAGRVKTQAQAEKLMETTMPPSPNCKRGDFLKQLIA